MKPPSVLIFIILTVHLIFAFHHSQAIGASIVIYFSVVCHNLLIYIVIYFSILFAILVFCNLLIQNDPIAPPTPADKKSGGAVTGGVKTAPPVKTDAVKGDVKKDDVSGIKDKAGEGKGKGKGGSGGELNLKGNVEESGVEECDASNRCIDEKNMFVACLRVPGKDSLDLSLLIENKGTGSLDVIIIAPSFVKLEQATVRLQSKENKEVKVSVQDGANDTTIVLKAGEGNCSLNFINMITNSPRSEKTSFGYTRLSTRSSLIAVFLAAITLGGVVLLFIKYRKMNHQEGSPRYQKLDMELPKTEVGLPVSSGGKKESDDGEADGWDGSWDDNWDEEAAPVTPSRSVQNLSSKGLASRKSIKDGWKD